MARDNGSDPPVDLTTARRVVVKIGTNTLCGSLGHPDAWYMGAIADEIRELRERGKEVILVSSGAIGSGRAALGFKEKVREIRLRQACAAVGQARLMEAWDRAFARHGILVAQLLLTYHTFSSRRSYLNLRNATEALLELGVVPVVNENDTVSIDEIDASFGDNDKLCALVASKVEADALVVLSDVAGLYTRPPGLPGAELVPVVDAITPEVLRMAGAKAGSSVGRGGMTSKLEAARIALEAGVPMVITRGREPRVLTRLLADGERLGTLFTPQGREQGKKRWLAIAKTRGRILVDEGAARALRSGKHLLPAGVVGVEGAFDVESVVEIAHGGTVVAKAVSELSSRDLERVKGLRTEEAKAALGIAGAVNVTRKGKMVLS